MVFISLRVVNPAVTRLYRIWAAMKNRCQNPHNGGYANYGGRGITVCEEWQDFKAFETWALTSGYTDELTIERLDVNAPYCPENCTWATMMQQANNKTNNRRITFNGKTLTVRQWDRELGFRAGVVNDRLNVLGWPVERALTEPVGDAAKKYTYNGETHTLPEWAELIGISRFSLWKRVEVKGLPIEVALSKPKHGEAHMLTFEGRTLPLAEWAIVKNIKFDTLWKRLFCSGWSVEKALSTPVRGYRSSAG